MGLLLLLFFFFFLFLCSCPRNADGQSDILRIEIGPGGPELQLFHRAVHELIENLRLQPRNEP